MAAALGLILAVVPFPSTLNAGNSIHLDLVALLIRKLFCYDL